MKPNTLLEVLDAAHLTKHIQGAFPQRGGIMLIGPPQTLKTTYISNSLDDHNDALIIGDINIQTLMKLRSDFRTGRYSTLAFTEFSKLYARRGDSASNIEACIAQLVEEGFSAPSFVDQRISLTRVRCMVIGAMTEHFYERKFTEWIESGFARRFLWCNISISNSHLLMDAIGRWQPLDLGTYKSKSPGNRFIKIDVDDKADKALRRMIKNQAGTTTPYVLVKKIYSVLCWKYSTEKSRAMEIMEDFAPSLTSEGAEIQLREEQN